MIESGTAEQKMVACIDRKNSIAEEYLKFEGEYKRLNDLTKIVEAFCFKDCPGKSATEKSNTYRSDPSYIEHMDALNNARLGYDKHKYHIDTLNSEIDAMRTIISLRKSEASMM